MSFDTRAASAGRRRLRSGVRCARAAPAGRDGVASPRGGARGARARRVGATHALGVAHASRPFAPPPPLPARGVAPPKPRPGRADPGGGGSARARGFAPARVRGVLLLRRPRPLLRRRLHVHLTPGLGRGRPSARRRRVALPLPPPRRPSRTRAFLPVRRHPSSWRATRASPPVLPAFAGEFRRERDGGGHHPERVRPREALVKRPAEPHRAAAPPPSAANRSSSPAAAAAAVGMLGSAFAPTSRRSSRGGSSPARGARRTPRGRTRCSRTWASETRARILGANQAGVLAGAALGPALGGLVAAEFGTRAPFALVAGGAALAAAHAHVFVRETLSRVREGDGEAERGRRGAEAEADLDAGLDSREERSEGSEGSEGSERASAFVRRERVGEEGGAPRRRVVEPPSPSLGALLTTTPFASACALNAALFFSGAGGRATLLPLLASERFAFGPAETGAAFAGIGAREPPLDWTRRGDGRSPRHRG